MQRAACHLSGVCGYTGVYVSGRWISVWTAIVSGRRVVLAPEKGRGRDCGTGGLSCTCGWHLSGVSFICHHVDLSPPDPGHAGEAL